jgi:hypothetical protein
MSPGDLAVMRIDAQMRPSRADASKHPLGVMVAARKGELVLVLSLAQPRGAHGRPAEVLTPRGETAWIWVEHLTPG